MAPRPGPRWRSRAGFPLPPPMHSHALGWVPCRHQSQPVIGTDHRRERPGRAGKGGKRELPRACPPPAGGGYCRIPSTWQGGAGGGTRAQILASSTAAGPGRPGSINSAVRPEACLPATATQAQPPGSGPAPRPAHARLVQGTGLGHSPQLASPTPCPEL